MKRNEFIKTLGLAAGVLATGSAFSSPSNSISLKELINKHSTTIEMFCDIYRQRVAIRMWGIDGDNQIFRNITEVNKHPDLSVHYFDPKTFGKDANKHFLQVDFNTYDSVYEVLFDLYDHNGGVKSNSLWYAINHNSAEFFKDVTYINIKDVDGECVSTRYDHTKRTLDAKNTVIYHLNPNLPGHIRPIYLGNPK